MVSRSTSDPAEFVPGVVDFFQRLMGAMNPPQGVRHKREQSTLTW